MRPSLTRTHKESTEPSLSISFERSIVVEVENCVIWMRYKFAYTRFSGFTTKSTIKEPCGHSATKTINEELRSTQVGSGVNGTVQVRHWNKICSLSCKN
jgi:hypothetical protein